MTVDRPSSGVGAFVNPGDQRPADRSRELGATGERDWSTARLAVVIALLSGIVAALGTVGADSRWLAALGHVIAVRGAIPDGIPFAAAPTGQWANPLVLAEMIFYGLEHAFGDRGLIVAQTVAVAAALTILAIDARADGASSTGNGQRVDTRVRRLAGDPCGRPCPALLAGAVPAARGAAAQRDACTFAADLPRAAVARPLVQPSRCGAVGVGTLWAYLVFGRVRTNPRTAVAVGVRAPVAMSCLRVSTRSTTTEDCSRTRRPSAASDSGARSGPVRWTSWRSRAG